MKKIPWSTTIKAVSKFEAKTDFVRFLNRESLGSPDPAWVANELVAGAKLDLGEFAELFDFEA